MKEKIVIFFFKILSTYFIKNKFFPFIKRYKPYIKFQDNKLYNKMISKELKKECKKINIDIHEILHNNYDDDVIYKIITEKMIPSEIGFYYLPSFFIGLSLLIILLFSYSGVGHKEVKENVTFTDLFKYFFSVFFINFLPFNIILLILNTCAYLAFANYRLNLIYSMAIFCFIIPFITFMFFLIKVLLFPRKKKEKKKEKKEEKKFEEKRQQLFNLEKSKFKSSNSSDDDISSFIAFDVKYDFFETFTKPILCQIIYLIYFGYKINKTNLLQDKIILMKNNLNIAKSMKAISEEQNKILMAEQNEEINNYDYN